MPAVHVQRLSQGAWVGERNLLMIGGTGKCLGVWDGWGMDRVREMARGAPAISHTCPGLAQHNGRSAFFLTLWHVHIHLQSFSRNHSPRAVAHKFALHFLIRNSRSWPDVASRLLSYTPNDSDSRSSLASHRTGCNMPRESQTLLDRSRCRALLKNH